MDRTAQIDIVSLAREIAFRLAPDALLDSEDVGALLKCAARSVTEYYALLPGFPKSIRLNGPRSRPKWKRGEVMAWIEGHTEPKPKRAGRPRNLVLDD